MADNIWGEDPGGLSPDEKEKLTVLQNKETEEGLSEIEEKEYFFLLKKEQDSKMWRNLEDNVKQIEEDTKEAERDPLDIDLRDTLDSN